MTTHLFRLLVFSASISLLSVPQSQSLGAESRDDSYLTPINEERETREPEASYRKAVEEKLFLTPGEIARVVRLPGTVGVETVVAVYRQKPPKQAEYAVTVTQPSKSLWDPENNSEETALEATTILRLDAGLPKTTALAIQKVWEAMLLDVREPPESDEILLESSTQIFSAAGPDGKLLRGQLEGLGEGKTAALSNLVDLLVEYCDTPETRRLAIAYRIEKAASALLERIASSNGNKRRNAKSESASNAALMAPKQDTLQPVAGDTSESARTLAVASNAAGPPPDRLPLGNPPPQYRIVITDNPAEMRFDVTLLSSDDRPLCVSGGGWPNGLGQVDWGSSWVKLSSKSRIFPARDWDFGYCEGKDCSHRVRPKGTLTGFIGYAEFGDPKEISALPDRRLLFEASAYICPNEQAQRSDFSSSTSPQTLALVSSATESLPADNTTIVQLLSDGSAPLQRKIADLPTCVLRGLRRWYEKPFVFIEKGQGFPKLRDIRRAGDGQFRLLFFSELKDASSVLCFEDHTSLGLTRRAVIFRRSAGECSVIIDFAFDLPLNSLEQLQVAINTQRNGPRK